MTYQPKTGQKCSCHPGVQRDNCPNCEGTGQVIDFAAIRAKKFDEVGAIIAYENGELDEEQTIDLFQHLDRFI